MWICILSSENLHFDKHKFEIAYKQSYTYVQSLFFSSTYTDS